MKKIESHTPVLSSAGTVLYVEDEEQNWDVTQLRLRGRHKLVWAKNAKEACESIRKHQGEFLAILMDIQLKGSELDGTQITALFRNKLSSVLVPEFGKNLPPVTCPIFFVTAYGEQYPVEVLNEVGGDACVSKPVDFLKLSNLLAQASMRQAMSLLARKPAAARGLSAAPAPAPHEASTNKVELGPAPVKKVMGRYELISMLGSGGMAEVFLARQTSVGGFEKKVALKRILPALASDLKFVEMLVEEARLAVRMNHPNVVQIFDLGHENGSYFIVMEYVDGDNLFSLMRSAKAAKRKPSIGVALRIAAAVATGLHAAHSNVDEQNQPRPILHCDVSPHNVLISKSGRIKVSDFGIAKASDVRGPAAPDDSIRGKILYLAPELIKLGSSAQSTRSDVFAAGVVLYELLTEVHPFKASSIQKTFEAIAGVREPPSKHRGEISPAIDALVAKALAVDPALRHQSAGELAAAIDAVLEEPALKTTAGDIAGWLASFKHAHTQPHSRQTSKTSSEDDTTPVSALVRHSH